MGTTSTVSYQLDYNNLYGRHEPVDRKDTFNLHAEESFEMDDESGGGLRTPRQGEHDVCMNSSPKFAGTLETTKYDQLIDLRPSRQKNKQYSS